MYVCVNVKEYPSMYHVLYTYIHVYNNIPGALLKFDGDFAPDLGTEDSPAPADIVSANVFLISDCHKSTCRLKRFGAYVGLKDAAPGAESFKPMYVRFHKREDVRRHDVRRGIILGQHFESGDFASATVAFR
jgi:hypothetical protein